MSARIRVEDVFPSVENGRFAVKRIVGEPVEVWADIFRDGHELISANLKWGLEGDSYSNTAPMVLHGNDRWTANFTPSAPGKYQFAIEAWTDRYGSWARDLAARKAAGQDLAQDLQEGRQLLEEAGLATSKKAKKESAAGETDEELLSEATLSAVAKKLPRADYVLTKAYPVVVDRKRARFGAWYEMVPRSQGRTPGKSGTFDDCIARLPDIAAMGFDVIYLTPIHPIGRVNRKGRNNSLTAAPDDPGSFYAIGSAEGGHDAVHPELGGIEAFRRFVAACGQHDMEVALDMAVQCAPDHPWVKQHPQWFRRRPDGSIRYAENPPKKYEDIVNVDFYCEDWPNLWAALRDVVLFWAGEGIRIFRVDNPHTKPLPFWEWMIAEVKRRYPDVLFLSEAFTRPKLMLELAKLGFTQSYTYFTWRNTKAELVEYLSELASYPVREFFNPNFFVTTPDILPVSLQGGDTWLFKARAALAAMLSASYGIYNGFELIEHEPLPGREEYLDSEKYELKTRDWNRPGNIKDYIANLNSMRRAHKALQQTSNLRFLQVDHGGTVAFLKESPADDDAVAMAIAAEGAEPREFWLHFGDMQIGPMGRRRPVSAVENLANGARHELQWGGLRLRLDPQTDPMLAFRCL